MRTTVLIVDDRGFELASRMATRDHPPSVIPFSSRDRTELEPLVEASDARGFLSKSVLSKEALQGFV